MSQRFYRVAKVLCNGFCRLWFKLDFQGLENLPQEGGFILISNHLSYWDPVMLGLRLKPALTFMANEKLFHKPVLAPVIRALGAFPVNLKKNDLSAIRTAKQVVKDGKVLALFPEGTRSKTDGHLLPFKPGAVYIASVTGEDVVPACITYSRGGAFRSRVTVRFGDVVPNAEMKINRKQPDSMKNAVERLHQTVLTLQQKNLEGGA